jgi:dipeptidyl-peptidase-3
VLTCTPQAFAAAARAAAGAGASFPLKGGETLDALLARLQPHFFDPAVDPKVTDKTPPPGKDILTASANNLYVGVTMKELEGFKEKYPLNSRLVKQGSTPSEEAYRVGGRYGAQILRDRRPSRRGDQVRAEPTAKALRALITFYQTGETRDREAYDIAWVEDKASPVDTINGFIEVYLDARGVKGAWEALVFYVNRHKTAAIQALATNAQWFEDRMPWDPKYRKQGVRGITANAIDVVIETGDSGPVTPIGINLPERPGDPRALRQQVGVALERHRGVRQVDAAGVPQRVRVDAGGSRARREVERAERGADDEHARGDRACVGARSASGSAGNPAGSAQGTLLGARRGARRSGGALLPARSEARRARPRPGGRSAMPSSAPSTRPPRAPRCSSCAASARGTTIAEDHMRNRQMIAHWLKANTKAIEVRTRDGKTYYVVTDVEAFHEGTGRLLAEVQRIKAEGDYAAAKALFETYGVHFDPKLRDEVVSRVDKLGLPSYSGFVMPKLDAAKNAAGEITDVSISYPQDLAKQMLEFSAMTRDLRR